MKAHFFFLFFVWFNLFFGQENLIYNGSFEEYYSCPTSNDLNNGQFELAKGWWKASCTPDYFNSCNADIVSVPNNFWGFQEAFHGDGYIGIVPLDWNLSGEILSQEYFQTKLIYGLESCMEYEFSMYVSLSNKSTHGIGKLAVFFGNDSINIANSDCKTLSLIPQIINDSIIIDTNSWTKITGNYIANGGEKFVTIGYFSSIFKNDTILLQELNVGVYYSYYFIDSISLISKGLNIAHCSNINFEIPNVFTPNKDKINDEVDFSVYAELNPKISILNRWGIEVINLKENSLIWDGKDRQGYDVFEGIYFYRLTYDYKEEKKYKNGYIHLIRD